MQSAARDLQTVRLGRKRTRGLVTSGGGQLTSGDHPRTGCKCFKHVKPLSHFLEWGVYMEIPK